jgi:hypothetical protein
MESKIIEGVAITPFSIKKGELYITRNGCGVVLATSENKINSEGRGEFSGVIVCGEITWSIGHYSTVWNKKDFMPFIGVIEMKQ